MWKKVVQQKFVGFGYLAPHRLDRSLADRVGCGAQAFDVREELFVLIAQGLSGLCHFHSLFGVLARRQCQYVSYYDMLVQ